MFTSDAARWRIFKNDIKSPIVVQMTQNQSYIAQISPYFNIPPFPGLKPVQISRFGDIGVNPSQIGYLTFSPIHVEHFTLLIVHTSTQHYEFHRRRIQR